MSEMAWYDNDETETGEETQENPGDIKSLRQAASGKKQLEKELLETKRLLAFARAGIDPDDPRMKYFVKGYEGDLTAQAVREAATEAGFITVKSSESKVPQEIAEAQDRVVSAAVGASVQNSNEAAILSQMEQAMQEGGVDAMLEVARQYGIPIGTEM
jgi:hypothetical protein